MARPKKMGLSYFPLDTDFFDNDKRIKVLNARYKSDGVLMYIYLLCEIYKEGYYIEVDDDLEYIISSELGMSPEKVKQVLNFLLKRSLFNDKLFNSDKILTSTGIQKRFQIAVKERARKNPVKVGRFWLLSEEETEPFIKCTLFSESTGKTNSYSGKNVGNSGKQSLKESKENNYIFIYNTSFTNQELRDAFSIYIKRREEREGELNVEDINLLVEDLKNAAPEETEQLKIVKKAIINKWKSFYPITKKKREKDSSFSNQANKNKFNNFEGRQYNYDDLEKKLLG